MKLPAYAYHRLGNRFTFFFTSVGNHGEIIKAVYFNQIISEEIPQTGEEVYNLSFGDLRKADHRMFFDHSSRSNNGDMMKVLATIVKIATDFMAKNKNAIVSFSGFVEENGYRLGKNQRNMLYQRIIDSNWHDLNTTFRLWGVCGEKREPYIPGKQYDRILVQRIK